VTVLVYAVVCASALVFVAASLARAVQYARAPLHLRWEVYPVPHEAPDRVAHGGSYFEQGEWWRERRKTHLAGELRVMVPEILFLHALRKHNRPLWYRSFPFHFGLYLLFGTAAWLLAAAMGARIFPGLNGVTAAQMVHGLAGVSGVAGVILTVAGAIGLLHRRLTDPALRVSTVPGDVFNLIFFILAIALLGVGYAMRPAGSPDMFQLAAGLAAWDTAVQVPPLLATGIVAAALLVAYIPLTHMSHFVAKYFTYHAVRWDDAPMTQAGRRAAALAEYLTFRPTWSAGHIRQPGETPTWAEIVASNPAREPRR
jgi:nitrate reductase gamma subunit